MEKGGRVDLELAEGERFGSSGDSHEGFDGFLIRPDHCSELSRESEEAERKKGFFGGRWKKNAIRYISLIYRYELPDYAPFWFCFSFLCFD